MSATNTTPNYNLSQFIGTDKPAWLQDYNGDMLKIDTGINEAKTAADNAASAARNAQTDATSALNQLGTLSSTVSSLVSTVGTAVGNINTINSLIGNGTPTTTDQTIIGAINEINADKLSKTPTILAQVDSDGVKTWSQLLDELYTMISAQTPASFARLHLDVGGTIFAPELETGSLFAFTNMRVGTDHTVQSMYLQSTASAYNVMTIASDSTITFTDESANVVPVGVLIAVSI